jgi:alkylation response protein AidB-like acyl-CoA dehydrogenase
MRFDFTDEQQMWYDTVNRFMDTDGGGREYVRQCDIERRYPYELYDKVAQQGWLGLMLPEEYGGMGADAMFYAIFMGAMGKYSVDFAGAFGVSTFTAMNIVRHGTPEQKKRYLPAFVEGRVRFSISMTEPNAGSDVASLKCRAELKGDQFVINGQKVFASAAHVKDNVICMAVRTDPNAPKHKGISLVLVPNNTPGVDMRLLPTLARRATGTNEIFLTDARVPRENLIGELNHGWQYLVEHLEIERLAIAAGYAACAETAVADAIRYARERHQFGRAIAEFQVIKHMLADMQTHVEAASLMVYRLAYRVAQGRPCAKEAAMAKLFASETLLDVATKGMQILGGYAQLPEFDMERYWREGKQATVGAGTSQIQRSIIAKSLGL